MTCTMCEPKNISTIFKIPINKLTLEETLDLIHEKIEKREKLQIGVVNAAKIVNMHRNEELNQAVMTSDVILADGAAVVWASRILGCSLPERVAGIDLMMGMLDRGNKHEYKVYCLGATGEVSDKVAEKIAEQFPNVSVVGRHDGYFSEEEEEDIARDIADSGADILFVAITSPKKERFLGKWSEFINVPICHGVGGSFDVMAGKVERAPERWQKLGLEWLYRVKQEPRRLWRRYLVTNALFCKMVLFERFKKTFSPKSQLD